VVSVKTIYSAKHKLQHGQAELFGNKLVPCHERPARAEAIRARVEAVRLGEIIGPQDFGLDPILSVHSPDYVDFLEHAWGDWCAAGGAGDALPCCTPMPDMGRRVPTSIYGKIAYYSFDTTAPITAGTWEAAYDSAQVALTGADLLGKGEQAAFALCRPPGHHASRAYYGGYCFLNNAAIAAEALISSGMKRVAILDVDFHHGNGTQSIFYHRDDVLFVSIHGDPDDNYPFFLGHAGEKGTGKGQGYNINFPLPQGTIADKWFDVLAASLESIRSYRPEALVISLGVDTYENDPISYFKLKTEDYLRLGERLATLEVPTLFVMEGGYNVDMIGVNVTNVLQAFESSTRPAAAWQAPISA
jgi:acetoin utilization deacetylase AcuC-like enzyme